jgi:Tol biopolymer transport system component
MSADGSGVTRLTYPTARQIDGLNIQDYSPAWSPDAKRIAFVRGAPGALSSIYVMRADGTGATRITTEKVGDPPGSAPRG